MSINIYVGEDELLVTTSGIGFYGSDGFSSPVMIGEYNGRTFVTSTDGSIEGFECNNNKKTSVSGVINGQSGSGINLINLPNELATVNIRFENTTAVRTLNAKLYIFDGSLSGSTPNIDNDPTGLTCYCAEIRHTNPVQAADGLGDDEWFNTHGSTYLAMVSSPGSGGFRPGGSLTTDTRHDWFAAISCTPFTYGDKVFALYFECEFL
jgi:hypothetical protein